MSIVQILDYLTHFLEYAGILIIFVGFIVALIVGAKTLLKGDSDRYSLAYTATKRVLGRGLLLGLETLVAADLIRTVAIDLTLTSLLTLSILVIIRTFLSWSLQVELDGAWPWKLAEVRLKEKAKHLDGLPNKNEPAQ